MNNLLTSCVIEREKNRLILRDLPNEPDEEELLLCVCIFFFLLIYFIRNNRRRSNRSHSNSIGTSSPE